MKVLVVILVIVALVGFAALTHLQNRGVVHYWQRWRGKGGPPST